MRAVHSLLVFTLLVGCSAPVPAPDADAEDGDSADPLAATVGATTVQPSPPATPPGPEASEQIERQDPAVEPTYECVTPDPAPHSGGIGRVIVMNLFSGARAMGSLADDNFTVLLREGDIECLTLQINVSTSGRPLEVDIEIELPSEFQVVEGNTTYRGNLSGGTTNFYLKVEAWKEVSVGRVYASNHGATQDTLKYRVLGA